MLQLTPDECRVLGVLIEKAQTTPNQYPLTLNAVVTGCNQKNNRFPETSLNEDQALAALDGLRGKGVVREVSLTGSRVPKFRHTTREALEVSTTELVVLAELLLRGPQTIGELRGRASRMHPLESLEVVTNVLQSLGTRAEPLVREVAPAPGTRAARFAQLLCPDLHPLDAVPSSGALTAETVGLPAPASPSAAPGDARLDRLEAELVSIRAAVQRLAHALGEPDPFAPRQ